MNTSDDEERFFAALRMTISVTVILRRAVIWNETKEVPPFRSG
jgi:hypothetical protein